MPPPVLYTTNSVNIFISSVPKRDKGLRKALEDALHPLLQQGLVTIWYDDQVNGGERRERETTKHLDAAQLILILLSMESLALHDCHEQMLRAMERYDRGEATVIPILLRHAAWESSPCGMLKPLPDNGKPVISQRDRDFVFCKIAEHVGSIALRLRNESQKRPPMGSDSVGNNLLKQDRSSAHLEDVRLEQGNQSSYLPIYRNIIKQPPLLRFMLQREQVMQKIYSHLTSSEVTALVLTGMAGSGKSVLATQVYHYVRERQKAGEGPFVDEVLWLTIDATVTLADIVGSLSEALGRPLPYFQSRTADDLAVELFNLFHDADRPRLIVFDQFQICLDPQTRRVRQRYASLGAWLDMLNSRPCASRVLLTSRFQPYGTHQNLDAYIQNFEIKGLERSEGTQLLQMKVHYLNETEIAVAVEHCQGHPLALVLLRDLLCENHSLSIHAVLNEPIYMNQWVRDIGASVLNQVYAQHLNQVQRELLLAFSIYRKPVPLKAVLMVIESRPHVSADTLGQALHVLLHHSLLQDLVEPCYQLHPVVTDFMRALLVDGNKQADKQVRRIIHARAAQYYRERFIADPLPIWEQHRVNTIHCLIETIWHLCQAGQQTDAYELVCQTDLFTHLHRQGSNSILLELYTQLISLDEWQPDVSLAARISNEMGEIYNALGQKNQALRQYERALQFFREIRQTEGIVEALNNLGAAYRVLEQYNKAKDCYYEALQLCEESGERIVGKGTTLNNLGKAVYEQGRQKRKLKSKDQTPPYCIQALTYYKQALVLHQETEHLDEEAHTLNNMGEVYAALQQTDNAHECYWRALKCFQEYGERRGQGMVFNNLGVLYKNLNRKDLAKNYYIQALRIFREVGDFWQQGKAQRNLGRLYFLSKNGDTYERYKLCLACFLQVRDPLEEMQNLQYEAIPLAIEYAIREELGPQNFEQLHKEVEANAASIMELILSNEDNK